MANDNGGGAHDDYLNAPDTAGRPMALMSLITVFLVIAAIALALFIGGRWFYNEVVKGDEEQTTSEVATGEDGSASNEGGEGSQEGQSGEASEGQESTEGDGSTGDEQVSEDELEQEANQGEQPTEGGQGSGESAEGSDESSSSESEDGSAGDEDDSINAGGPTETDEQDAASSTVTGPTTTEEVPNTGPESMLAIFIGVTVVGAIVHRKWLVNKL